MRRLWISGAVLLSCILGVGSGWFLWQNEGNTRAPSAGSDVLQDEGVAEMSRYENGKYGFSFSHPASYTVTEMEDAGADIVLIRDAFGNALQIAVSPFDEDLAKLTPELLDLRFGLTPRSRQGPIHSHNKRNRDH